jgi:hypothetical protein
MEFVGELIADISENLELGGLVGTDEAQGKAEPAASAQCTERLVGIQDFGHPGLVGRERHEDLLKPNIEASRSATARIAAARSDSS